MSLILAIESTCDETAAAVVRYGREVLSSVVASQVDLHAQWRGVVPEIASRAHVEQINVVLRQALDDASATAGQPITLDDIDAIAVAHRPGLIGSLLVGVTAAKTLAWSLGKPLIGVDHVQAHLYSVCLDVTGNAVPELPAWGLVISGGHTALYHVEHWHEPRRAGGTIDDAVGEAYDKVAAILDLHYPGGPHIDALALTGDAGELRFPRSLLAPQSLDFSFSGLKTAVLYHVRGYQGRERDAATVTAAEKSQVAAAFQQAVIDVIIKKLKRALKLRQCKSVIVGGGVAANRGLRAALQQFPAPVYFPPMKYCTDNAAMSGGLAHVLLERGMTSSLDLDAVTSSSIESLK